jgi:hypothetical protein
MRTFARVILAAAAALGAAVLPATAQAKVHITVDLDAQTIHVEAKGQTYDWKVSSGKPGYDTPIGTFKVLWMDKDHHSDEYEGAYMPDAIFFAPGYAIHGFGKSPWGHKASHGCVRLPMAKAEILFDLVKAEGADISVIGQSSETAETVAQKQRDKVADPAYAQDGARGADAQVADAPAYPAYPARAYPPRDAGAPDYASGYYDQDVPYGAPRQRARPSDDGLFGSVY